MTWWRTAALVVLACGGASISGAQTLAGRGFVDVRGTWFPQDAPNDDVNLVGDATARVEAFYKPLPSIQAAAGVDLRANSHGQVRDSWHVDWLDRDPRRAPLAVRRLSATLTARFLTVDAGKQFIRWGKTDIVTPTDRLAPRDFMNVIDSDFLPVTGVRATFQAPNDTVEIAWVPWLTPSRVPLLNQRWSPAPAGLVLTLDEPRSLPSGQQAGVRWGRTTGAVDYSLAFFNGFNHLPNIDATPTVPGQATVALSYPRLRLYGGDVAVPTVWFIIKAEAGYFTSSSPRTDEYAIYVVQIERQAGEWSFIAGYAGETIVKRRSLLEFAPDRGLTKAITGRASLTIDTNRSLALEGAVRQTGEGLYLKGEYSQASGQHWRTTISGAFIHGEDDDFLGQYHHNSNVMAALRYSF